LKTFLTIAASDSSGGAGIQQDIKMAQLLDFWGVSVVTAITAQDRYRVHSYHIVSEAIMRGQLEAVFADFHFDAVKIGVVPSLSFAKMIAEYLQTLKCPIVYDPVLASSSGFQFTPNDAREITQTLCSVATIVTPNLPELEFYAGKDYDIASLSKTFGCGVYIKGGHNSGDSITEHLIYNGQVYNFQYKRCNWNYTHGTGCTFSSLLSMYMATLPIQEACTKAHNVLVEVFSSNK